MDMLLFSHTSTLFFIEVVIKGLDENHPPERFLSLH